MTTFEIIKKLSQKKDITLKQLSEELNFGESTIYKWKNQTPKIEYLELVADYFDVSVDYLLGRTESTSEKNSNLEDEMFVAFRKNEERLPESKREEYRKEMERYMRFVMSEMEKDD